MSVISIVDIQRPEIPSGKEWIMISGVNKVGLAVGNQDEAKRFWTEQMGFEIVEDLPYDMNDPDGPRWIEVTPPEQNVTLVLSARRDGQPGTAGTLAHVLFHCDDIRETYEQLTKRVWSSLRNLLSGSGGGPPYSRTRKAACTS
jgi:lactoylglutathione lyase